MQRTELHHGFHYTHVECAVLHQGFDSIHVECVELHQAFQAMRVVQAELHQGFHNTRVLHAGIHHRFYSTHNEYQYCDTIFVPHMQIEEVEGQMSPPCPVENSNATSLAWYVKNKGGIGRIIALFMSGEIYG